MEAGGKGKNHVSRKRGEGAREDTHRKREGEEGPRKEKSTSREGERGEMTTVVVAAAVALIYPHYLHNTPSVTFQSYKERNNQETENKLLASAFCAPSTYNHHLFFAKIGGEQ